VKLSTLTIKSIAAMAAAASSTRSDPEIGPHFTGQSFNAAPRCNACHVISGNLSTSSPSVSSGTLRAGFQFPASQITPT
jgi:hypothetical protein